MTLHPSLAVAIACATLPLAAMPHEKNETELSMVDIQSPIQLDADNFGKFDEDFDWQTQDAWYTNWHPLNLNVWSTNDESRLRVSRYDDSDEWGIYDW